jgi:hypothetical protein
MYEPITVEIDRGYGEESTYRSYTIRQSLWRNCCKYSDGLQSKAPLSRKSGTSSALMAALRYQKHAMQTLLAIYQTACSEPVWVRRVWPQT